MLLKFLIKFKNLKYLTFERITHIKLNFKSFYMIVDDSKNIPRTTATKRFLEQQLEQYQEEERNIYMTSSFQTQSVPLLHIISSHFPWIQIILIDTGYLFPETYAFKVKLTERFELNVMTVRSDKAYTQQRSPSGLFLYTEDTNHCCHINKVEPMEKLVNPGDVWISGVRKDQTRNRETMKEVEKDNRGVIRVHPMLEWTSFDVYNYIKELQLPKHPLEDEGFASIGCVPCTHEVDGENGRDGRWMGSSKTECGLHKKNNL
jgi:phosphoadenosine phosphosulfate reductase